MSAAAFRILLGILGTGALALNGCDAPRRYAAAQGIHDFLAAVQADDRVGFEAHVDRPALRTELRRELAAAAAGAGLSGRALDRLLNRGGGAIDQLITPGSFRIAWRKFGGGTGAAPSALELAALVRMLDPTHACLHDARGSGPCILTFADEGGTWKLEAIQPTAIRVASGRTI